MNYKINMSKIVVLSDIHGNLTALNSVLLDIEKREIGNYYYAFLGDNINYGLRSNEVISILASIPKTKIFANIRGNHEDAIENYPKGKFSTKRGEEALKFTKDKLTKDSFLFIKHELSKSFLEINYLGRKILFVHGNLNDPLWGSMNHSEMLSLEYKKYDFVFSGHTHKPQYNEIFYKDIKSKNRGEKKTIFINPGSVGQPRNHNPRAHYMIVDILTEECHFHKVPYNIKEECINFNNEIDKFYINRLNKGI